MKSTQGNEIYQKLKGDIISLNLEPGLQLSIKDLVASLGVSRSPIRDAFIKLSDERLVKMIPQSGCKVTQINCDMAEQERFIRKSIELEMFKRRNLKITIDFMAKQKANLMFQKNALEANDLYEFFKLDEEFHQRFFDASGLLYTWQIIENNTCSSYQRVRVLSMRVSGATKNILLEHENLLLAAEAGDYEKMYQFDSNHLSKIDEELPFLKQKFPNYFE